MSKQRYCAFRKANDDRWYMFLASEEYGGEASAVPYGPFNSYDDAREELRSNHSNPGGIDDIDSSGTIDPPEFPRSPSGAF